MDSACANQDQQNMTYRSVVVTKRGGPDVLQVVESALRQPGPGEARIKVLAASVSRPDVTVRTGESLYSGTPLDQKVPFVPGYSIVGVVDAVGDGVTNVAVGERVGALTVVGGYTEYIYWRSDRLIPVPATLDPAAEVIIILNYIVAYQVLHRSAKVKPGDKVLIIGASGGIGTALLQLGKLAGLSRMYGLASQCKHAGLVELGAIPIDYHTQDFVEVIRQAEPDGLDAVFDGMSGEYLKRGLALLRRGGTLVGYGEPAGGLAALAHVLARFVTFNLLPNGRTFKLYGTSFSVANQRPFYEDWAILFKLLEEGKIQPIIAAKYPILDAAEANRMLESGTVFGNVVLAAPELLT